MVYLILGIGILIILGLAVQCNAKNPDVPGNYGHTSDEDFFGKENKKK